MGSGGEVLATPGGSLAKGGTPPSPRLLLPQDESAQQWHRKGILAMPVFVDQPDTAERCQHLIDVTRTEWLIQMLFGISDNFLHRKFFVTMLQVGDDNQQFPLTIRCSRPSSREKVVVQLARDFLDRYRRLSADIPFLQECVIDFAANELQKIGIAPIVFGTKIARRSTGGWPVLSRFQRGLA